jgi:hypothetical protein
LRRMHQEKDEHEGVLHSANAAAVLVRFDERDLSFVPGHAWPASGSEQAQVSPQVSHAAGALTRLPLHALTRLLLHAYSNTLTLTRLLLQHMYRGHRQRKLVAKLRNVLHSTDLHVRTAMLQELSSEPDKTREAARAELQFAKERYTQRRNAGFIYI